MSSRARQARRPELGLLEWFALGESERVERVLALLAGLDVRHLRTAISWADWHTADGPAWYDWLLPRLAAEVELLPCVLYTPPSLAVAPRPSAPPRRPRDYADFVDQLIDRYGTLFEHVELWNEPNNIAEWDWTLDQRWHAFAEMVGAAAYWARRRAKRTVLGGMSPVDPGWLQLMGERGVLAEIDVIGIHGFPGTREPGWQGWEAAVASLEPVLREYAPQVEVWITEAGFSTWRHDELGQLRAFLDAVSAPVGRVYWYGAEDLDADRAAVAGFHSDERDYHFGLQLPTGMPKLLARVWTKGGLETVRELDLWQSPRPSRGHTLVIGGAGFIGSNLCERLLERGERVLIFDNLSRSGAEDNVRLLRGRYGQRLAIEIGDLRDRYKLRGALARADSVFHLAAQVAVTTSLVDPIDDFEVNLRGTVGLIEELRRLPHAPPLLYASTNKVYGSLGDLPLCRRGDRWEPVDPGLRGRGLDESWPLELATPYGCSKGGADQYVLDATRSHGLDTLVFRLSCVYGPHQHGTADQGWVAHVLRCALEDEPITIYGDGAQVRDLLYAEDLVEALVLARDEIGRLRGMPFNLGGGPERSISFFELLDLVEELHGERPSVSFAPERLCDQRYYVADSTRFEGATGWQPTVGVDDGLARLYEWLLEGREERPLAVAAAR